MSFGRPGNLIDSFNVNPPEKGSFPLDHDHDCSPVMKLYLSCLKNNQMKNESCRLLSKQYLQCRFDHGLMEKTDWPSLGFPEDPSPLAPSPTATVHAHPDSSLPTPPPGSSGSPREFVAPPLPDSVRGTDNLPEGSVGTGAGPVGVLGGQKGAL